MEYRVTWEIEVNAESHKKAAEETLEVMRDPISEAVFFHVERLSDGKVEFIDLREEENDTDT